MVGLRIRNCFKFFAKFVNSIQTWARRNKSDWNKNESHPQILLSAAKPIRDSSQNLKNFRLNSKGKKIFKAKHLDLNPPMKRTKISFLFWVIFISSNRNVILGRNLDLLGPKNIFGFLIFDLLRHPQVRKWVN